MMDVVQLILMILTLVGFIAAIVLRFMVHYRGYAKFVEVVSLVLFDVVLLLKIVNGIKGMNGAIDLLIFISALSITILRLASMNKR